MSQKTSQLQIRVSPREKEELKRRADAAGLSLSAYVLSRALPEHTSTLQAEIDRIGADAVGAREGFANVSEALEALDDSSFEESVGGLDVSALSPLLQNVIAGAVEEAADRQASPLPRWIDTAPSLRRPFFAPDLPSLRPSAMRRAPIALKRRNVFLALSDGAASPEPADAEAAVDQPDGRLQLLGSALLQRGLRAELCPAGGAFIVVAFQANPGTDRPRSVLAPHAAFREAATQVGEQYDLPSGWFSVAARELADNTAGTARPFFKRPGIAVFDPPTGYLLAARSLALNFGQDDPAQVERDLSYLLRYRGFTSGTDALSAIAVFLNERQRPANLLDRLSALI